MKITFFKERVLKVNKSSQEK